MRIPVPTLIDGVERALLEAVLPELRSRSARGQLYAAVDVLRNLRDRIAPRPELLEAEAVSLARSLELCAEQLQEVGAAEAASQLRSRLGTAGSGPALERLTALRESFELALTLVDALPEAAASPAQAALGEHLASQALRSVSVLKPSLLGEISRG